MASNQQSSTEGGWIAGGGVEYAIDSRWSLKGEYLYYDLADTTMTTFSVTGGPQEPAGKYSFSNDGQIVRVGLNYRF